MYLLFSETILLITQSLLPHCFCVMHFKSFKPCIVVVDCLLYLFYHSQRLYLLFTYPYYGGKRVTSVTGSVGFLCEGAL